MENETKLSFYEKEAEQETAVTETIVESLLDAVSADWVQGSEISINCSEFKDFSLRPELLRAIVDCGFEHPSEVQRKCIPQAILGMDILCQAGSGMGKSAVFVLATLQQLDPVNDQVSALVMCHTRYVAFQISKEFECFSKYMPAIKVGVFIGGMTIVNDEKMLKTNCPHIVVGTPGRIHSLVKSKKLNLRHIKHFALHEYNKILGPLDMRRDVLEIFHSMSHEKQVMMFSDVLNAAFSEEIRPVYRKFLQNPVEVYVDDTKLTLDSVQQYYVNLQDEEKSSKLLKLLQVLKFNKVIIFNRTNAGCRALSKLLNEQNFPAIAIHGATPVKERFSQCQQLQNIPKGIVVTTNFGQEMDIKRVNLVFNYDIPKDPDTYFHNVTRAGSFGIKGRAITFVTSEADTKMLDEVQVKFNINILELPEEIDTITLKEEEGSPEDTTPNS